MRKVPEDRWRVDWLTLTAAGREGRRALWELTYGRASEYCSGPNALEAFKAAGYDGDPVAMDLAAQAGARKHGYERGWSDVHGVIIGERGQGDDVETVLVAGGNALQRMPSAEFFVRQALNTPEARCSRLDVARDHFGLWTPGRVKTAHDAYALVSGFREGVRHAAWSFYFAGRRCTGAVGGRRGGGLMLRVYDKLEELRSRKKPTPADTPRWTRWEFQLGAERAATAFDYLGGGACARELHQALLGSFPVRVVRRGEADGKNRWRVPPSAAWGQFILDGGAWREHPSLGDGPEASSDDEASAAKAARFARVVGPTFAALARLLGPAALLSLYDGVLDEDPRFAWARAPKASVQRAAVAELLELRREDRRFISFMQRCRRA